MSGSRYVHHYDKVWEKLLQKQQDRFPLRKYRERSILTTWTISYEQVVRQSEAAGGLMRLWGFLASEDLWYQLIASIPEHEDCTKVTPWLLQLAEDELEFSDAVGLLVQYSLVETRRETSSHSMHSVLHRWCYYLCTEEEKSKLFRIAADGVAGLVPSSSGPEYWKLQRRLLPHGRRVLEGLILMVQAQSVEKQKENRETGVPGFAYHTLGVLFADRGKFAEAEKMYQRALEGKEKALGPKHASTLITVDNLGSLYSDQGKLAEAEKMYQRALEGKEKALGPEHTTTLDTVNNLGNLYRSQGKLVKAGKMYQRALEGYEKVLGPEHTSTLSIVTQLSDVYMKQCFSYVLSRNTSKAKIWRP